MDATIRRDESLQFGRLIALPPAAPLLQGISTQSFRNVISIDFPAAPDVVELARSADYAVNWNMVLPDGIHQYRGTKPLEIPIAFKLHFQDDKYCKQGALTLIQLAARLHSFILPISTFQRGATVVPVFGDTNAQAGDGRPKDSQIQANAAKEPIYTVQGVGLKGQIYNPVTCWLHLMWVAAQQPGISCIGYVKDVKVAFSKPFMRGPNGSFNLPTSAEYSFTFVHRPGHGNGDPFTSSAVVPPISNAPQAFADDVKDGFYNTTSLAFASNYQGFRTGNQTAS